MLFKKKQGKEQANGVSTAENRQQEKAVENPHEKKVLSNLEELRPYLGVKDVIFAIYVNENSDLAELRIIKTTGLSFMVSKDLLPKVEEFLQSEGFAKWPRVAAPGITIYQKA